MEQADAENSNYPNTQEQSPLQRRVIERIQALIKPTDDEKAVSDHLRAFVLGECMTGKAGDPLGDGREWGTACWKLAVGHLTGKHKWWRPATNLLVALWDQYSEMQIETGRYVPREEISQYLSEFLWNAGEHYTAMVWSMHAHAARALEQGAPTTGFPAMWMHGAFGLSNESIDSLSSSCNESLKHKETEGYWQSPAAFPEDIVLHAIPHNSEGFSFFSRFTPAREFHLCPAFLRTLKDSVADSPLLRGKQYENVASYLNGLLPACAISRNLRDNEGVSEHDLVVQSIGAENAISAVFGQHFLVECKNWKKKVGTKDVGYFLLRMAMTQTKFGIIFAKNDISGQSGYRASKAVVRRALAHNGSVCVAVTGDDLDKLAAPANGSPRSFQDLLFRKINELKYGS